MSKRYKLHLFPFSNYCEKVLWALDTLGVRYDVQIHYPGMHSRSIRKLSKQTSVPVLEDAGTVIAGSAAIIEHVMQNFTASPLLPSASATEILKWQKRFDDIGGTLRGALFYDLLPNPRLSINLLTAGQKHPLSPYGIFFRMMIPMLQRMLNQRLPDANGAREHCVEVLNQIATATKGRPYLVGDGFTLADLAAAAIFFPICMPMNAPGHDLARTNPDLEHWFERWRGHAAIPYIERLYAEHRTEVIR